MNTSIVIFHSFRIIIAFYLLFFKISPFFYLVDPPSTWSRLSTLSGKPPHVRCESQAIKLPNYCRHSMHVSWTTQLLHFFFFLLFLLLYFACRRVDKTEGKLVQTTGPGARSPGPVLCCVAYVFEILGSIIICRLYTLTFHIKLKLLCNWESVFPIYSKDF